MKKPEPLKIKNYENYKNLGSDETLGEHLGEYFVRKKLITWEILNYVLIKQMETKKPLGEILEKEGYIPLKFFQEYSINRLFNPNRSISLAKLLKKIGKIDKQQMDELLFRSNESQRALGSILLDEGIISPEDFTQEKIVQMLNKFEW